LVVEEVKASIAGRAGDCGCGVVSSSTGCTACDSAVAGRALRALSISEVASSADIASAVAGGASDAASDEEVTCDADVGLEEGVL
jgi:hypothetical protein